MKDQHDNQTGELMMDENDGFISDEDWGTHSEEDWRLGIGYGEGISAQGEE